MDITKQMQMILNDIGYKPKDKDQPTETTRTSQVPESTPFSVNELVKSRILSTIFDYALKGNHPVSASTQKRPLTRYSLC